MRTIEFTDTEFMIAQGARLIEDGKTIFVGWGIRRWSPCLRRSCTSPT